MQDGKYYWIKLKTDFFDPHGAMAFLMSQKNGSEYVVLYLMLCLSTANTNGRLCDMVGEMLIPYNVEKIKQDTKYFSIDTVRVALELYRKLGLIYEETDGVLKVTGHDDMVGSETKYAEKMRKYREKLKLEDKEGYIVANNVGNNVRQEIRDKSIENRDIDIRDKENRDKDINTLIEQYNSICISLPSVQKVSDSRKRAIKSILKKYSIDDLITVFEKAQESNFLSGRNGSWKANFDWLIKENNLIKVLEGNYCNDRQQATSKSILEQWEGVDLSD